MGIRQNQRAGWDLREPPVHWPHFVEIKSAEVKFFALVQHQSGSKSRSFVSPFLPFPLLSKISPLGSEESDPITPTFQTLVDPSLIYPWLQI